MPRGRPLRPWIVLAGSALALSAAAFGGDAPEKQVGLISEDGQRVYRFPQRKTSGPSAGDIQANLENKTPGAESNFHVTIVP